MEESDGPELVEDYKSDVDEVSFLVELREGCRSEFWVEDEGRGGGGGGEVVKCVE